MTVFIDTVVIMYAAGREHPLREPCRTYCAMSSRAVCWP